MRIAFLSAPFNMSGGQRVISIYADRLARRGHEVVVVAPPYKWPSMREAVRVFRRGHLRRLLTSCLRQPLCHFQDCRAETRRLAEHRPVRRADVPEADVVIATWWETAEWACENFPADLPKFYLIQHYEPKFPGVPEARAEATWRLPIRKIVISNWLAELAETKFDDPDRILIPNSVDTEQFFAPPRGKQAVPTVGMLYSDVPWKGCDVSLKALDICRRTFPDVRLVSFGGTRPVVPLPAGTRFVQSPPQESIRDLYASCDVFLNGSHSEGFNLTPLEAMACRCPVVVTRTGAMPELVREGVNGHLVEPGDVDGLAKGLVDVLSLDDAKWREMSGAAYRTATDYTWDDATDRLEAALLEAVPEPAARPSSAPPVGSDRPADSA